MGGQWIFDMSTEPSLYGKRFKTDLKPVLRIVLSLHLHLLNWSYLLPETTAITLATTTKSKSFYASLGDQDFKAYTHLFTISGSDI
jgi:hypothetical protein